MNKQMSLKKFESKFQPKGNYKFLSRMYGLSLDNWIFTPEFNN